MNWRRITTQRRGNMNHDEKYHGLRHRIQNNFFFIGILSIVWFIGRTGRKPSRASYPCQQTAALNGNLWIATYIVPIVSGLQLNKTGFFHKKQALAVAAVVIIAVGGGAYWFYGRPGLVTVDSAILDNGLTLSARTAVSTPSSDIFVVTHTNGADGGADTLFRLMGSQDLKLYQSSRAGQTKGPDGLISADDVVIIKVNCQWDERGGTNTDLLKALIQGLIDHPDGFTGEIIVSDNGQGETRGSLGRGGSFTYPLNNALDTSQSIQDVVDGFSEYSVSTYLWSDITETRAYEYSEGHMEDGYVVEEAVHSSTGLIVSYPKFTTEYGTHVSFKNGVWSVEDGEYDSDVLKVINLSMLKSHQIYGVTASVKNYMGVPSDLLTGQITGDYLNTHSTIGRGGMGTLMANTRFPVLNIIDSIWINPVPLNGPWTPYRAAMQMNVITAGTDPVALDYWSVKYILLQNWENRSGEVSVSMDPDNTDPGFFGNWLRLSRDELEKGGYTVNIDETSINVYMAENAVNQ
jgi:hypothetical protein